LAVERFAADILHRPWAYVGVKDVPEADQLRAAAVGLAYGGGNFASLNQLLEVTKVFEDGLRRVFAEEPGKRLADSARGRFIA
jgi:hypothetical protein